MVDALDSKSGVSNGVRVRVPSPAKQAEDPVNAGSFMFVGAVSTENAESGYFCCFFYLKIQQISLVLSLYVENLTARHRFTGCFSTD